jgi:neopullulanase
MPRLLAFTFRWCAAAAVFLGACAANGAPPTVTKVEPPNWWPDHSLNPLQLLIHGTGLDRARVQAPHGMTVSNVHANAAGTYLFAELNLDRGLTPGEYPLEVSTPEGSARAPFRLSEPLSAEGRFQGFSPDDVVYLIMPDRFANGDTNNDNPAISPGLFGRANSRYYHGGDLQGIIDHLDYFRSLGVTALWLTPVYDNTNRPNQQQAVKGRPIADYHGYGTVDYYNVEEHFGDLALLRKLVDEAHRKGLKVIQDQVANHVGPGHPWVTDPPKPTWFHGTAQEHINETWQIWTLPDGHASAPMQHDVVDGWFQNVLPDLNQEDPDVAQYEIQNALWWVGMAGFDGIRQDTLPYVARTFWRDWSRALKQQYPALRTVGEVFDPDPAVTSFFQGGVERADGVDSGIDAVFDFPLYFNMRETFAKGGSLEAISKTLARDRLYPHPETLVTFLGNHDVPRFLQEPGATAERLKLAFTLLLTMRGTPCIYYGDEIGMAGGADPDNRRDFPGGWKEDRRSAFDQKGRTPGENALFEYVRKLTSLRAELEPLRRGTLTELAVGPHTYAFARQSAAGTVIVAFNSGAAAADIPIRLHANGSYRSRLTPGLKLQIEKDSGTLRLPGGRAEVFTLDGDL